MKKSRLNAVIAVACAAAVFAALVMLIIFAFQASRNKAFIREVKEQKLTLSASFTVTAETGCLGTAENSYLSAKTGVNSGAQAIAADISFRKDGTPVLAAKLRDADNDAVPLERVFDYLAGIKDVALALDLKQVTNLPEIDRLAVEKELTKRLIYTGINLEQVGYLQYSSPNIRFYIDCKPAHSKADDMVYCAALAESALSTGAIGINCESGRLTETLVEAVHAYGLLVSVYGVDKEADMYRLLSFGVDNITTVNPDLLLDIIAEFQAKAAQR